MPHGETLQSPGCALDLYVLKHIARTKNCEDFALMYSLQCFFFLFFFKYSVSLFHNYTVLEILMMSELKCEVLVHHVVDH